MQKTDWETLWKSKTENRLKEMREEEADDTVYWSKRAKSYSDAQTTNDFVYGKSVVAAIQPILSSEWSALDVGSGPGTLAIPLAKHVRSVTAIEPAPGMVDIFKENASHKGVDNYRIVNSRWQDIPIDGEIGSFDLVISSHVLWHFVDIWHQITRMEKLSKGYCCMVNGISPYGDFALLWEKVTGEKQNALDGGDSHLILYNLLFEKGRKVNVAIIEYKQQIPVESWITSREMVFSRHIELTSEIKMMIRDHIMERSDGTYYEMKNTGAVMFWKV